MEKEKKKDLLMNLIYEWMEPEYHTMSYEQIAEFILIYQEEIENIYTGGNNEN